MLFLALPKKNVDWVSFLNPIYHGEQQHEPTAAACRR